MTEWWTYRLSSFLLFSPRTWLRLLETYNREIWPLQIAALALGVAILVLVVRNGRRERQAATALLAACWVWTAFAFHLRHYATINWAATYFAAAFALEGALIAWLGVVRGAWPVAPLRRAGLAIFVLGLVAQPAIGWVAGIPPAQWQCFGVAPDPTALSTMGLALASERPRRGLLVVPLLWSVASGAFAWAMRLPDALVMPIAALVVVALVCVPRALTTRRADPI